MPGPRRTTFSSITRAVSLAGMVLVLFSVDLQGAEAGSNFGRNHVVCREELAPARREELAKKLRKITGLADLKFDDSGTLRFTLNQFAAGSESARKLLAKAINGGKVVVIEDASNRSDVAFARVIPGKWTANSAGRPPVFVVQIDFSDFDQVVGDERAREAFNVGWGFLHELDHIANDSVDALALG